MISFASCYARSSMSQWKTFARSIAARATAQRALGNSRRAALALVLMVVVVFSGICAKAESYRGGQNSRALVERPIDETKLVTLPGNTHPAAVSANDRGPVADATPIEHMQLLLQRPAEVERQLEKLIDEQQKKGSPDYHKWLTAQQFGERFGVAPADIEKVSAWLESRGFRVISVQPSGMVIEFSGNAGQVKQAFHTEIHHLDVKGEAHFANMSDPQIPAALSGVVKGVHALHNFMPHALHKQHAKFTVSDGEGDTYYAVAPADLATIYNLNPAFTAGYTGTGQTVVVIEDTLLENVGDVATFRTAFGLSTYSGTFTQITATGSTGCSNSGVNSDEGEAALDAEWAGASAPNAAIVLASCADTETVFGGLIALQNLTNGANPPQIVSISYGECEVENGATANASYVTAYQQAVAEGISVFVASGDEGAASCDADLSQASHGIAVSGFTSTPYNVSVGGTDFGDLYNSLITGPSESTYWSGSNTASFGSALSYIPEIPWNDSCASQLIYTVEGYTQGFGSSGFCNSGNGEQFQTTASGSGGPSTYETGNKPAWQSVFGNPSDNTRDIPDVSLFAANGVWGHFLVYCLSDVSQGGSTCDFTNSSDVFNLSAGGTSFASPIMAGIQALVNQAQGGARQGNPNARYYNLANTEFGTSGSPTCDSALGPGEANYCVFNDVTFGDMDVNCVGTNNCYGSTGSTYQGSLSTSDSTLQIAYGTNAGWDFATGLGSVNAYNLILNWNGAVTSTVVTSGTNPAASGASVTFTATITPGFGTGETGTVAWSTNTGCAASAISAGVATCTTSLLASGTDTVTATYSGDSNFAGSIGNMQQMITGGATATHFSVTTAASVVAGTPFSITIQALSSTNTLVTSYAGTVHFTSSDSGFVGANLTLAGGTGQAMVTLNTTGTQTITATDTVNSSLTGTGSFTVAAGTPGPAVITSPTPGSTLGASNVTFSWTTGTGVTAYQLWLGTSGVGSSGLFNSGTITTTSITIASIPSKGVTVYARLYSEIGGKWQFKDYTYTELGTAAVMVSPAGGTTFTRASETFVWTAGAGVTNYQLWLGTSGVGSSGLYNSGSLTTTSATVTGIPAYGATVYVRLFSEIGGAWRSTDYTYTEMGTPAVLAAPKPGTTLSASNVTFTWSAGRGVTAYQLWIGSSGVGSSNWYNSGTITTTTETVPTLPANGTTLYVRLLSETGGVWSSYDYTFVESGTPAVLTSPTQGSTLGTSNVGFTWTAGIGNTNYQLWLGTSGVGSGNVYNSGSITGTTTTVTTLPAAGATIYARLYSLSGGVWLSHDYTFIEQ